MKKFCKEVFKGSFGSKDWWTSMACGVSFIIGSSIITDNPNSAMSKIIGFGFYVLGFVLMDYYKKL